MCVFVSKYKVKRMFRVKRMLTLISLTLFVSLFYFVLWIFTKFTEMGDGEKKRLAKWYFGGLGSAGAACCTHPLDLIKVHLQTAQGGNMGAAGQAVHIVRSGHNHNITTFIFHCFDFLGITEFSPSTTVCLPPFSDS